MLPAVLAAAAALVAPAPQPCRAPLPQGPNVPAPIVLRTSCGAFRLSPDGRVTRLPRGWLARHGGGTGRRYGADLALRRTPAGRVLLLRDGRLVWRSRGLYRNDGGDVAFGPRLFAFAAYRRGIFVTDLEGPERLVLRGRGLFPYAFTRRGELLVVATARITVVARDGRVLRRHRFRPRNGLALDPRSETLYFVSPDGALRAAQGARVRTLRRPHGLDGSLGYAPPGLLTVHGRRSVAVLRLDGSPVARTSWPARRPDVSDSGLGVSPDGRRFAFRLSDARPGAARGTAVVHVLRSGSSRARPIYRHALGPSGCGVGGSLSWSGRFLLYASVDGERVVLDTRSGRRVDLRTLARALPRRSAAETADTYWARGIGR